MATGVIDTSVVGIGTSGSGPSGPTELAHILPFSIGQWDNNQQDHKVTQIWATLTKCFPGIKLGPTDINHPTNLMTLYSVTHKAFGEFTLAFEPTSSSPFGDTNEYKILTLGRKYPTILDRDSPQPNALSSLKNMLKSSFLAVYFFKRTQHWQRYCMLQGWLNILTRSWRTEKGSDTLLAMAAPTSRSFFLRSR
ncbi:hypothetical protein VTN77DRAFT_4783 [Rasamsonia byssochlamydoides]|uniref:uncharacterized protein n=1 Tax=Rasamsonia byssochlamydoides TaxID=89139 RepID=UPI00374476AA